MNPIAIIPHFSRVRTSRFRKVAGSPQAYKCITLALKWIEPSELWTTRTELWAILHDVQGVERERNQLPLQYFSEETKDPRNTKRGWGGAAKYSRILAFPESILEPNSVRKATDECDINVSIIFND
jgi:hypothetical protein